MLRYILITIFFSVFSVLKGQEAKWEKVFDFRQSDSTSTIYFERIICADTTHCLAFGNIDFVSPCIYSSSNAGVTWSNIFKDNWSAIIRDAATPSSDFCIVACDSGSFLRSTNFGLTWHKTYTGVKNSFYSVSMLDKNNGILTGGQDLLISHDGFQTWKKVTPYSGNYLLRFARLLSPSTVYCQMTKVYNIDSTIVVSLRSEDEGDTWTEYNHPPQEQYISQVCFVDSLIGYKSGSKPRGIGTTKYDLIFKSNDGGRNWEKILDTVNSKPFGLSDISMFNTQIGIVVGDAGKIYWTDNGGKVWRRDSCYEIEKNSGFSMKANIIGTKTALIADRTNYIYQGKRSITSVSEPLLSQILEISPNPHENFFFIRVPKEIFGKIRYEICNILGIPLITIEEERKTEIDLKQISSESLPNGIYYLHIQLGNKSYTGIVIKSK